MLFIPCKTAPSTDMNFLLLRFRCTPSLSPRSRTHHTFAPDVTKTVPSHQTSSCFRRRQAAASLRSKSPALPPSAQAPTSSPDPCCLDLKQDEKRALDARKVLHIRELKRVAHEDRSKFARRPTLSGRYARSVALREGADGGRQADVARLRG